MTPTPADLVIFGINAGLRLAGSIRKAYVTNLQRRELTLPLVKFSAEVDFQAMLNFFWQTDAGKQATAESPRLQKLLDRADINQITDAEKEEVHNFYFAEKEGNDVSSKDLDGLFTLRQWTQENDTQPNALQRVAGSLVEIGVEYFNTVPGAINPGSKNAEVLKGFLEGLQDIPFSDKRLQDLAPQLMVSSLELLQTAPQLVTSDANAAGFLKEITTGVLGDAQKRMQQLGDSPLAQGELASFSKMLFTSMVSSTAEVALANPQELLGTKGGAQSGFVTSLGSSIMGLAFNEDGTETQFKNLLTAKAVDSLLKAGLQTAGQYPEIFGKNDFIQKTLVAMSQDLAAIPNLVQPSIGPEVVRLVLEKAAANLQLLTNDDTAQPNKSLINFTSELLKTVATKPKSGSWKPVLSTDQVMYLTEFMVDELVQNPQWLIAKTQDKTLLNAVANSVFEVLSKTEKPRINGQTAMILLQTVVKVSIAYPNFLKTDPNNPDSLLLDQAMEGVFDLVFHNDETKLMLAKEEALQHFTEKALQKLEENGANRSNIENTLKTLKQHFAQLEQDGKLNLVNVMSALEVD